MVFGHKNHFQAVFSTLQQILTFLPAFQFLCCLTVVVVCERVLNDLKRFDTNLVNKLFKKTFFLVVTHENHFYAVLSVFYQFLTYI